jgi:hypothetical protein
MANGKDKNYVSVWFWMLAMFVMAIPCIGWVMILVWAFWGDNESRRNYFKAILMWCLIWAVVFAALLCLGLLPIVWNNLQKFGHKM